MPSRQRARSPPQAAGGANSSRTPAGLGPFPGQAAVALQDRRLARLEGEVDRRAVLPSGPSSRSREVHRERQVPLRRASARPVAEPDPEGGSLSSGQAHGTALQALEGAEAAGFDIGESEVGEVDLTRRPARGAGRRVRGEGVSEEGELEAEAPPRRGRQVSRVVPPLGAEFRVRAVVGREVEDPGGEGPGETLGRRPAQALGDRQPSLKLLRTVGTAGQGGDRQEGQEGQPGAGASRWPPHYSSLRARAGEVRAVRKAG